MFQIQVRGEWAGTVGGWRPAVAGTLNQTSMSDESASTFEWLDDATRFVREHILPEFSEEREGDWRVVNV